MRKVPKSFTVEVKRRPSIVAKKPQPFLPDMPEPAPQRAADALFRSPDADATVAASAPERRILPCLVTEAALDAAKAEALVDEPAARPRGRPRKERAPDDLAPLAPRKRGRPRKVQPASAQERPKKVAQIAKTAQAAPVKPAPRVVAETEAPARSALPLSGLRVAARRSVELPRSERWKRRLPKALR